MKKFKFRLQKVKELKEEIEKQKMQLLAKASERVAREEMQLEMYYKKQQECYRQLENVRTEAKINPVGINYYYSYLEKLEMDIKNQKLKIAAAKQELEKRRKILLAATKERKVLDKLKSRQHQSYMIEMFKKEQAIMDDLAATHYSSERM